jgi:predicted AlkP superfamily phosphohydrolase/phosphomutase
MNKVIIIGLDGADFEYIDPLLEKGKVPNIRRLIAGGFSAEFDSSAVPCTSQAWPSILTGADPGRHGVYDRELLLPECDKVVAPLKGLRTNCFWHYLSEKGVRSLIINVPMVYPVAGCEKAKVISGFDAPLTGDRFCYPVDYLRQLEERGVAYDWHIEQARLCQQYEMKENLYEEFRTGIWRQSNAVIEVSRVENWDCLMTVFQFSDWIVHRTGRLDLIERTYLELDEVIGKFTENWPSADFFVLSDHGIRPVRYRVSINKLLADLGLVQFHPVQIPDYHQIEVGIWKKSLNKVLSHWGGRFYKRLPMRAKALVTRALVNRYPHLSLKWGKVDFSRSEVFFGGMGSIYINSKSKFSNGIVDNERANKLKGEVERAMQGIKDQNGRQIIECARPDRIWRLEDTSSGSVVPDLVFRARLPGYCLGEVCTSGKLVEDVHEELGVHCSTGILLGAGPKIPQVSGMLQADLVDFAPTLFNTLGLPVPRSFAGQPLFGPQSVRETYRSENPIEEETSEISEREVAEVEQRLRDLGYM